MACEQVLEQIIRGDTINIRLTFAVTDDDGEETPEDITGWELRSTLKNELNDADVAALFQVSYTVPAGANATAGIADLTIPSTDTDSLSEGTYWFDIQRVIAGSPPMY